MGFIKFLFGCLFDSHYWGEWFVNTSGIERWCNNCRKGHNYMTFPREDGKEDYYQMLQAEADKMNNKKIRV